MELTLFLFCRPTLETSVLSYHCLKTQTYNPSNTLDTPTSATLRPFGVGRCNMVIVLVSYYASSIRPIMLSAMMPAQRMKVMRAVAPAMIAMYVSGSSSSVPRRVAKSPYGLCVVFMLVDLIFFFI